MTHLLVAREYPPAPYPPGGIGTYVRHLARLLAEHGETVHVIAQRWAGASAAITEHVGGRLIVHRLSLGEEVVPARAGDAQILRGLAASDCPTQAFSWQVAHYAEHLV